MNIMSEWALKREGEAENVRMEGDGGRGADKAALTFWWRGGGRGLEEGSRKEDGHFGSSCKWLECLDRSSTPKGSLITELLSQ